MEQIANDPVIARVAEILLAAYAVEKTVSLLRTLFGLKLSEQAIRIALGLTRHAARARPKMAAHGISPTLADDRPAADVTRRVAADDIYFRAAYLLNAATRLQRDLDAGLGPRDAERAEAKHYEAHRRARDKRLDAAAEVGKATRNFGPLLGWYRNWALDSDADCIAADGNNFDPRLGTVIGYPGSVHPNCGCTPGPPHADGGMVDDAVASLLQPADVKVVRRAS